ncbi:MAG: twin-arginine translocase TatA/TatE family subunit [Thaumarchaeota archaeon]|nr:MAG: twin-arginine translocase TatA/TatE family subunit [Nitrososphaerota archaeon]HDD40444.1 twin-arginine translocase TatA/TatE family subunit [Nitrososphaeria archaeon]
MPIHGLEWLFIAIILIFLVLWDPEKIPKIAKALAEAKREYEKATSTMQELVEGAVEEPEESDKKLIEIAKELGIETYGKTKEEIKEEILKRAKQREKQVETDAQPQNPVNSVSTTAPSYSGDKK